MKKLFLTICLLAAVSAPQVAADDAANPFARDIKILTEWFEGDFDNEEQLWFERDPRAAYPEDKKHPRLHTIHRRVNLPQFGEHVFYVEEYRDNDPTQIVRQRFVTFEPDLEAGAIRMQQGFFREGEELLGAHNNLDTLSDLKAEDVFFMKDIAPDNKCDVFWRRVGDQFEGKMIEKGCRLGTDGRGPARYSVHDLMISETKYWRVDSSFLTADDSLHVGDDRDNPIKMRRANIFQCEVIFRLETGSSPSQTFSIHDQGGKGNFTREPDGKGFELLIRQKEYPFYETRPDFIYFSIREAGAQSSLLFSVHDPLSRHMAVNFNGMAVNCYREGYEFRETLAELH